MCVSAQGEFAMRQTAPFVIRDLVEEALRTAAPAVNMNKVHHATH